MVGYGKPPRGGWTPNVCEILVEDLQVSLSFWSGLLGFEMAYQRLEDRFVYLQRPEGCQIMLCERWGTWETGPLERPFGRGVMFQFFVSGIDDVLHSLRTADWPVHTGPREVWRRFGDVEGCKREIVVQDPDGYLVMMAQDIGEMRPAED